MSKINLVGRKKKQVLAKKKMYMSDSYWNGSEWHVWNGKEWIPLDSNHNEVDSLETFDPIEAYDRAMGIL